MEAKHVAVGVIFLSQTTFGVLGNGRLFYRYLFLYFMRNKLKVTDWILMHLIIANFLTLLCKGVPQTMAAFGLKYFLNDSGCKLVFYLHRLGRGMSITSTCFLTVFQAITISPSFSWRAKIKSPNYITTAIYLSWILSLILNTEVPLTMTRSWNHKNITNAKVYGECYSFNHSKIRNIVFTVSLSLNDIFFLGLMLWASSSTVCVLFKHKQRMEDIRRSNFSQKSFPESRATKTILLLVSTFICFYTMSCILQSFMALLSNPSWLMVTMAAIVSGCFPAVSPFLLMSYEFYEAPLCPACARNRKA